MSKIKTKLKGRHIACEYLECPEYLKHGKCHTVDAHHHLFSNDKPNRRIYGDLIDCDFNVIFINNDCHISKVIPKYTELEFRVAADRAGYILPSPSKSMQFKKF